MKSQYEGKCKGFKNPDGTLTIHTWNVGDEIHFQKEPKCICINQQCFEAQKAAAGSSSPGNTPKSAAASIECKIANLKAFMELTKGRDVNALPAYAGVWNATR